MPQSQPDSSSPQTAQRHFPTPFVPAKINRLPVGRTMNDHTIAIVSGILVLTVLIQIVLVKSWT
jgi:hypothetical protein